MIKYGYGYISEITAETTKGDQTAITLMNGIVLVFDNTMLVPNAEMISTTLTKPIKEIKGATEQDQLDKFVMIEGINAFGYANENIKVANENSGYFNSISDLDKITISSIEYYFNDEKIGESNRLDGNSAEAYLSSSSKYYKYNTKKWMGRDALQLYQIPVLPGWVYGANDYADIEMRINLQFKDLVKALTIEEGKKYFVLEELKQNPVISDFYEYNETEKGYVETADDTAVDNKQYYELLPVKDENMMNNPKEAKYYEEQEINGKIYKLTEDTTIVSGKNYYTFKQVKYPAALGYYEQNGDVYTKTSDSTFISGKVYYTKKEETQPEAENCYTEVVETYTLSCPITVDKEQPRIVEKETTNVSDNVEFTLESHIKKAEGSAFTYYDDTLAITLPPFGTLTVEVVAQKKAPLTNHDMELVNISEFKEGVTYYTKNAENSYIAESAYVAGTQYYIVKTYKGTQTISSIYDKMDSTYYLGLSQIVGHTLNPDYNITVAFSGYDTGKVTRSGNFGFYCSYACNGCASGNEGSLMYTEVTNPIGSPTDNEYYELVGLSYVKSSDDVVDSGKTYYLKKEPNFEIKEKLGKITKIEVDGGIRYIPTENIVEIRTENKVEYVLIRDTNYVTELSPSESQKVVMLDLELKTISSDLLHLADMGALDSAGKQLITKYYVAVSSDGEYYQIVKKYNVYPSLFGFSTDDINHRVYAELDCNCVGDEKLNCKHNTFEFKTWSDEVNANYYGAENEVIGEFLKAKGEDVSQLYFELGDKDTTSASINKADGTITIDRDKYILDGTNFITINIYAKASGENGLYIDNNLSYSGNEYNEPVFTVYVYLKEANVAVS